MFSTAFESARARLQRMFLESDLWTASPIPSVRPGPLGPALDFTRSALDKVLVPALARVLSRQTRFNQGTVDWARDLSNDLGHFEQRVEGLLTALELRLARVEAELAERRAESAAPPGSDNKRGAL